jgi:hypothetical protein
MSRLLPLCALFAFPLAWADNQPEKKAEPTETVIRLRIHPAPAPKPALRYQLLPEPRELTPGNALAMYLLCYAEQQTFWFSKEALENREKWQTMPLKELPLAETHKFGYSKGAGPLRYADEASRMERIDWQLLHRIRRDGIRLLLPELQQLRTLASALQVRFRVELAEGRLDDALTTIRTLFALARNVGDHPTLIGNLVGQAIANVTIAPLDELLQQPGCPNLFWALTDLPHPLIELRQAVHMDTLFLNRLFENWSDREPMTEAQQKAAIEGLRDLVRDQNGPPELVKGDIGDWVTGQAKDEARVARSRAALIASGLPADRVKAFPPVQVVLLDEKLQYDIVHDDLAKLNGLPYWQAEPLGHPRPASGPGEGPLLVPLVSGWRVRQAQARLEQRLGMLRCVEAVRLYAAEHGGKLPASLADTRLPLPVDPVTGKEFSYRVEGETAILHGTPPRGMEKIATYNVRYEVTIAK